MALQRDTLYAGRFNTATTAHPQGAFKNRTTSTAQDGSYLEAQWLNDWDGFFGSLLSKAGLTPDGSVDAVGASQYFNALLTVAAIAPVGTSRNLKCSITTAASTATFTADELIVKTGLGGLKYQISNLSKTINLTTTGAGGMDTGSAPLSGYVAIYAIYNPTTGVSALLGYSLTSAVAPEVYSGSNMPSGYTASALISVWPTNSSRQMKAGAQQGRDVTIVLTNAVTTTSVPSSSTALSISSIVPPNAIKVSGTVQEAITSGSGGMVVSLGTSLGTSLGNIMAFGGSTSAGISIYNTFKDLPVLAQQTIYYSGSVSGTTSYSIMINITGYTF